MPSKYTKNCVEYVVCCVKRKHDKLSIEEKFVSCSNPSLRENLEIEVDISYNDLKSGTSYDIHNCLLRHKILSCIIDLPN